MLILLEQTLNAATMFGNDTIFLLLNFMYFICFSNNTILRIRYISEPIYVIVY